MKKVILITGTRKGLGNKLARNFLEKGGIVFGCSRGNSSIEHDNYNHYKLDVSDEKAVISMVRDIRKKHGQIDVLLNNAGIAVMNHVLTTPYSNLKSVFNTNFFGTFLFSREVAKVMIKNKSGRIINYTTVATPLYLEGEAIYVASKTAVEGFTKVLAKELADFGIRVNAIGPTPIHTDLIKNIPKDKLEKLLDQQAIRRFGTFEDVLNVVEFFINERSEFITGQIIYLGGVME